MQMLLALRTPPKATESSLPHAAGPPAPLPNRAPVMPCRLGHIADGPTVASHTEPAGVAAAVPPSEGPPLLPEAG